MTQATELAQTPEEVGSGEAPEEATPGDGGDALEALKAELVETRRALGQQQQQVTALQVELAASLTRYRDALLASAPEVPPEMVQGESAVALEEAFSRARDLVEQVRRQVEARVARERVPAGAPTRGAPDLSGLSAQEKVRMGLQQLQR
jgi:hypothetical protein